MATDLESTRSQWKSAEDSWLKEAEELRRDLDKAKEDAHQSKLRMQHSSSSDADAGASSHAVDSLQEKIVALEQERTELQACLDEALKELEAVDEELKSDPSAQ